MTELDEEFVPFFDDHFLLFIVDVDDDDVVAVVFVDIVVPTIVLVLVEEIGITDDDIVVVVDDDGITFLLLPNLFLFICLFCLYRRLEHNTRIKIENEKQNKIYIINSK